MQVTKHIGSVQSRCAGSPFPAHPGSKSPFKTRRGWGLPSGLEQQVNHGRGNQENVAYLQQVLGGIEASWAAAHHTDLGSLLLCRELLPNAWWGREGMQVRSALPKPTAASGRSWSFPGFTLICTLLLFFPKALAFAGSLTSSEPPKTVFIQSPGFHP